MLVNGHTGLLTPNRDIQAAAAALQALVFDKNKAARIGDSAKAEVELRYGHEAMKSILPILCVLSLENVMHLVDKNMPM